MNLTGDRNQKKADQFIRTALESAPILAEFSDKKLPRDVRKAKGQGRGGDANTSPRRVHPGFLGQPPFNIRGDYIHDVPNFTLSNDQMKMAKTGSATPAFPYERKYAYTIVVEDIKELLGRFHQSSVLRQE